MDICGNAFLRQADDDIISLLFSDIRDPDQIEVSAAFHFICTVCQMPDAKFITNVVIFFYDLLTSPDKTRISVKLSETDCSGYICHITFVSCHFYIIFPCTKFSLSQSVLVLPMKRE